MQQIELSNMTLSDLFKQLALLMQAGIPLGDGLLILSEEEKDPALCKLLSELASRLEEGVPFATAVSESGCFSAHVTGLLEMGERVGRTEETLLSLSRYYENRERMNRQLRNALTYPAILLLLMLVVIIILLSRVLPVFDEVYASLGGSLSGIAGGLLVLGNTLNLILPYLGILMALIFIVAAVISLLPSARKSIKKLWARLQGDRGIARKLNNAHFAQALSMAVSSGLPLEEGVALAGALLTDCPQAMERCKSCQKRLENGEELAVALGENDMLPPSACRMLTLGMRAGTGDVTMQEIADRLSEEAEEALTGKVAQIEPALVLITSVLVGAILLSVMLPLMNIMKAIG